MPTNAPAAPENAGGPDIYYILMDGYARADTLLDYFGYDSREFIGFLKDSGFQVADQSSGNYPFTTLVVKSMLHMDYVGDESGFKQRDDGKKFREPKIFFGHRVGRRFSEMGYDIVTITSIGHYIGTTGAERRYLKDRWITRDEFELAVLNTTVLPSIWDDIAEEIYSDKARIDFALDEITRQVSRPGPKLVMAHIMAPHQPFVYDREGNQPRDGNRGFGQFDNLSNDIRGYRDEVHWLNIRLKEIIANILENSARPPVIILQGDHGLRITRYTLGSSDTPTPVINDSCPREVFSNLSAIYLPEAGNLDEIPRTFSTVNTFRLIFDKYFGSQMGLLPDKSYFPLIGSESMQVEGFRDISKTVNSCSTAWETALKAAQ